MKSSEKIGRNFLTTRADVMKNKNFATVEAHEKARNAVNALARRVINNKIAKGMTKYAAIVETVKAGYIVTDSLVESTLARNEMSEYAGYTVFCGRGYVSRKTPSGSLIVEVAEGSMAGTLYCVYPHAVSTNYLRKRYY